MADNQKDEKQQQESPRQPKDQQNGDGAQPQPPMASVSRFCLTGASSLTQELDDDELSEYPDLLAADSRCVAVERMSITIKNIMQSGADAESVTVRRCANVKELKEEIYELTEIPVEAQALVHKETPMVDDMATLSEFGIVHLSTVSLTPKMTTGLTVSRSASSASACSEMARQNIIKYLMNSQDKQPTKPSPSTSSESTDCRTQEEKDDDNSKMKVKMQAVMAKRQQFRKGTLSQPATPNWSPAPSPKTPAFDEDDSEMSEGEPDSFLLGGYSASSACLPVDQAPSFNAAETPEPISVNHLEPSPSTSTSSAIGGPSRRRQIRRYRNGCARCKARLSIVEKAIKCRCAKCFCAKHRNPESHLCSYDYKAAGRVKIAEDNPKIVARKEGRDAESVRDDALTSSLSTPDVTTALTPLYVWRSSSSTSLPVVTSSTPDLATADAVTTGVATAIVTSPLQAWRSASSTNLPVATSSTPDVVTTDMTGAVATVGDTPLHVWRSTSLTNLPVATSSTPDVATSDAATAGVAAAAVDTPLHVWESTSAAHLPVVTPTTAHCPPSQTKDDDNKPRRESPPKSDETGSAPTPNENKDKEPTSPSIQ